MMRGGGGGSGSIDAETGALYSQRKNNIIKLQKDMNLDLEWDWEGAYQETFDSGPSCFYVGYWGDDF